MAKDDDAALLPHTEEDIDDAIDRLEGVARLVLEGVKGLGDHVNKFSDAILHLDLPRATEHALQAGKDAAIDAADTVGEAGGAAVKTIEAPVGVAQDAVGAVDAAVSPRRRRFTLRKRRRS